MRQLASLSKFSFLAVLVPVLVGCNDDHHDDIVCPEGDPTIDSITLTPDAVPPGGDINAVVALQNFELSGEPLHHTEAISPAPQDANPNASTACPGGHVHIYLDNLMSNPLTQAVTSTFSFTIPADAAAGAHTVMGRLHNRDHTILEPQVIAEVDISVQ